MDTVPSVSTAGQESLALAVVAASNTPVLLLDSDLMIVAASVSFCDSFGIDPANVAGRKVAALGAEWNLPQLELLLSATASGLAEVEAYELDLAPAGATVRKLVIDARKLDVAGTAIRLLVAISDVTALRADEKLKDDLLREKEILLQELQHRVANSLQIIASVLMQNARRVRSEQARGHLLDAGNRVMSIATMQRQLAVSRLGDVALRGYFTDLCNSIGASMIRDRDQISLDVDVDKSLVKADLSVSLGRRAGRRLAAVALVKADLSVSLGLIVTELVINALKHAFPRHRKGTIHVEYGSTGTAWTLSVRDTGIGMPPDHASAKPGLGTGIIEALARQMGAEVFISGMKPGTMVSIVCA